MASGAPALGEFARGIGDAHAWSLLAWDDVRGRYRRTLLGPLWLTLSHGIFICGLAISFSVIFNRPINEYFVYLAAGITTWMFIAHSLNDGPNIFIRAHNLLFAYDMPASIHIMRTVLSQLITFGHHMLIYGAALVFVANVANLNTLWAIPGLAIVVLAAVGWSTLLAVLGARYRDLSPAIASLTHMMFMLTPIFWERAHLGAHQWFALVNPIYHLIEVVRAPLLGREPEMLDWAVSGGVAAALLIAGVWLYAVKRRDLSYWI